MPSIGYLPDEIVHEVFVLLPIKCLVQCTAVCRSWRSLIKSSSFIHAHLSHSNQNDLILLSGFDELLGKFGFSLHLHNPSLDKYAEVEELKNPLVLRSCVDLDADKECFYIVGFCNGLVCHASNKTTIIWNPRIRKSLLLPRPTVVFRGNGGGCAVKCDMAYDPRSNDYKVLRTVFDLSDETAIYGVEIWSLARGSWKRLSDDVIPSYFRPVEYLFEPHVYVNGVLHWISMPKKNEDKIGYTKNIVTFDMSTEVFGQIMLPAEALEAGPGAERVYISQHGESSLAVLLQNHEDLLFIWVMRDYGLIESWTKLTTLRFPLQHWRPLGFRKTGDELLGLNQQRRTVQVVNPQTGEILSETDYGRWYRNVTHYERFVENIVLLDKPEATSY